MHNTYCILLKTKVFGFLLFVAKVYMLTNKCSYVIINKYSSKNIFYLLLANLPNRGTVMVSFDQAEPSWKLCFYSQKCCESLAARQPLIPGFTERASQDTFTM